MLVTVEGTARTFTGRISVDKPVTQSKHVNTCCEQVTSNHICSQSFAIFCGDDDDELTFQPRIVFLRTLLSSTKV